MSFIIPKNKVQKQIFEIDGKNYFWITINDMEKESRIMEVNADVDGFVKRTVV